MASSYNPHTVMREMDEMSRRIQAHASKAQAIAAKVAEAKTPEKRERALEVLLARLRRLEADSAPAMLTHWRAEHATPSIPQEPRGLPPDLVCKKCGEVKEQQDFFYDDGSGGYGFTHRCFPCRRAGRKGQPGARQARKAHAAAVVAARNAT